MRPFGTAGLTSNAGIEPEYLNPRTLLSESNACLHLLDDLVSKLFDVLEVKQDTEITATVLVEQLRY